MDSPLTTVTGVEITSAHGQAITSNTSAFVQRCQPGPAHGPGRDEANRKRHDKDGRRIDGREAINEALVGARELCATSTVRMMRASVVLAAAAVTLNSMGAGFIDRAREHRVADRFVDGKWIRRVTGAWLMAVVPVVMVPSSAMRSPGFTRRIASSGTSFGATDCQLPSA